MKGKDQVARIFSCKVEAPAGVFTKDSLPYYCLRARAYMPRTAKNEELIVDIDAGINKECLGSRASVLSSCLDV